VLPATGSLALGLFFLKDTVPDVIKAPNRWLVLVIPLFFLLIAYGSIRQAWKSTWWKRIPAPTDISRAFDFGDDFSNAFKTEPRNYMIRNPACAEAFNQLNVGRGAAQGQKQRARDKRTLWRIALFFVGLFAILYALGALIAWLLPSRH
jgi:disulfide bond formation protein DsbB